MFGILDKNTELTYRILLIICEIFGIISVILVSLFFAQGLYSNYYYDWDANPFSYHPVMMTTGLVFCFGNAILLYRTLKSTRKLIVKILHASFLIISLTFALVGLVAVIRYKMSRSSIHFVSFHSWLGLTTLILFFFQWIFGFVTFLFPKLSLKIRSAYMPTHRLWGRIIFVLAVVTVIAGLSEHGYGSSFFTTNDVEQKRRLIINFCGVFTALFGILVIYLVSTSDYQRPPDENVDK
ncbi:unnamed protein product [Adineta steineri]|uniref:Cytochrome b561 domain-containing protein n=1 Tax=Adineta steineri TaxID=433720 RepID=A0A819RPI1_9BILA|nr:unnamed protein product [Adineta steineri]CAF0907985.1 unnamed protein product [Adineta steineri]CAF3894772.1 unnamed protein product [Adineta steineri]CAF4041544.1 unnamed protein product [Adineta steineri]